MASKVLSLLLCISLLHLSSFGQQFLNGDFETVVGPCLESDCNYDASAFDCVPHWTDEFDLTGSVVFLQSASCPGDIVCDGNYAARLSTGAIGIPILTVSTPNPYFGEEEELYLISLTVTGDLNNSLLEVRGLNQQGIGGSGVRLAWQAVKETDDCTKLVLPLDTRVVDYPYLSFNVKGIDPGLSDIYIDNLEACGEPYTLTYDPCLEVIKITWNRDCLFGPDVFWNVVMVNETAGTNYSSSGGPGPGADGELAALPGDQIKVSIGADDPGLDRAGNGIFDISTYQIPLDGPPCCEDADDARFAFDLITNANGLLDLQVANFELYEEINADHYWYIYSLPTSPGEFPVPVAFTTTEGAGPHTIYTAGEFGVTYAVVHRFISDCGEFCDYRTDVVNIVDPNGPTEGGNGDLQGETFVFTDPCAQVYLDFPICDGSQLGIPSGLTSFQNGPFIVLSWDEVPGASTYIASSTSDPNCDCKDNPVPNISLETANNFIAIPANNFTTCFAWHVRAVCGETGEEGGWSEPDCYDSGLNLSLNAQDSGSTTTPTELYLHVYPNPVTDQLTLQVNLPYDSDVTIELLDAMGRSVQGYQTQIEAQALVPVSTHWTSIGQLSSGIYYVRYTTQQESFTKAIVVN